MNELNSRNSSTNNPVWSKFKDRRGVHLTLGLISYSDDISMFLNSFSLLGRWLGHGVGRKNVSPRQDVQNNLFIEEEYILKPWFSNLGISRCSPILSYVIDLLDWTTKWLTKFKFSWLSQLLQHGPFISTLGVDNPQLPISTMVLYQGYLDLLLWDLGSKEFPEVGTYVRIFPFVLYSIPLLNTLLIACFSLPHQTLLMNRIWLWDMDSQLKPVNHLASVLLLFGSFSGHVLFNSTEICK